MPLTSPKVSYRKHRELGRVHWIRDLEEGLAVAKAAGKPVFCLFQEIPGCSTCTNFGTKVLSHEDTVTSIENDFVPVAIFNNKEGIDRKVCQQYGEPSWNNPVVRFLDPHTGKDIIPRQDGVWSQPGIEKRMKAVLEKMPPNLSMPPPTESSKSIGWKQKLQSLSGRFFFLEGS